MKDPKLFVALDVDSDTEALSLAKECNQEGVGFKVGPRLVNRFGSKIIKDLSAVGPTFVDLKFFDIPNTMLSSVKAVAEAGATYCTVHALAGPEALTELSKFEVEIRNQRHFRVLAVTVLTSFNEQTLPAPMVGKNIMSLVDQLASDAINCRIKGLVCSAMESIKLREKYMSAFLVTPGIRPADASLDDQKRVVTPAQAKQNGASAIVVGRPILSAPNRSKYVQDILSSFN